MSEQTVALSRVCIRIAGEPIALETCDAFVGERWARRFASFLEPGAAGGLRLAVRQVNREPYFPMEAGALEVRWAIRGGRLEFQSHFERGYADLERGEGELWVTQEGSVENFLRVYIASRCVRSGGLLVHASAVVYNGWAFVFFGPSGSGKSTMARLSAESGFRVLGDDITAIRREKAGYVVYPVPFGVFAEGENRGYPLAGAFRLRKGPPHAVGEIPVSVAVAQLLGSLPFTHDAPALRACALSTCHDLARSAPVRELRFYPDRSVWGVIDRAFCSEERGR